MIEDNMKGKIRFGLILLTLIGIMIAKQFPQFIENYYIPYIHKPLAWLGAILLQWFPFSLGDLVYIGFFLWLFYKIYRFFKQKKPRQLPKMSFLKMANRIMLLIIVFNLIWGMAYNRVPFQQKINLTSTTTDTATLKAFYTATMNQLNGLAHFIDSNTLFDPLKNKTQLLDAYKNLAQQYPSLTQNIVSLKPSLFSKPLSYMGFHGYYNPLTTEAQINTHIPHFFKPIVALHEMAHQLGYAQEDQANFVGFLAAEHSTDTAIQYSYHFDLMLYSSSEIFSIDSNLVRSQQQNAHPVLKKHLREWRQFRVTHKSWANNISEWFYNKFLQVNATSKGVASYNDGLHHIIAWRKSVGKIQ